MDLVGRTLPPSLNCLDCGRPLNTDSGIYLDPVEDRGDGEPALRPLCNEHADEREDAIGVLVERRSRPENEEEWDEWYVITSVPDAR